MGRFFFRRATDQERVEAGGIHAGQVGQGLAALRLSLRLQQRTDGPQAEAVDQTGRLFRGQARQVRVHLVLQLLQPLVHVLVQRQRRMHLMRREERFISLVTVQPFLTMEFGVWQTW